MKKLLLGIVFSLFGFYAMGQNAVQPVGGQKGLMTEPFKPFNNRFHYEANQGQAKAQTYSYWYNWNDAAANYGASYVRITNAFIFPDSTVKQIYGNASGGTELGYAGSESVGEVFDPKSFYFGDTMSLNQYSTYTWDSLALFYYYGHFVPNSVDTLVIQYYVGKKTASPVVLTTFTTSKEPTAFVRYNPSTLSGLGAALTDTILLTENDTVTSGASKALVRPVGLKVAGNQVVAFTVTYHPGYSYSFGDTMDYNWNTPTPTKRLNGFIPYTLHDNSKTQDDSYNNGLKVINAVQYNLPTANGWTNSYIPGDAWQGYNEYIYSSFHITSENVGIKELGNLNSDVNLYPNPTTGATQVTFALNRADAVNIYIKDITGKTISVDTKGTLSAGTHQFQLNTEDLKAGVYFCTLTAGSGTKTVKFVVSK